jgi:chitinase
VDWEFPGQKGLNNVHRPEDKQNCTALLAELRSALDRAGTALGKRYLLTMATQAADEWLANTEMGKAQKYLDFVNLMAYDQFVDSDPIAGHHAPLYTNPANPKNLSAAAMIDRYIAAGVPASKIILGVPFYGRAWGEVPATANGLYQPAKRPPSRLPSSFRAIRENYENKDGFVRYWDELSKAPFLYSADRKIFISYDDEESIGLKARFVSEKGLAGLMFWRYNEDGVDPLLDAIRNGFN